MDIIKADKHHISLIQELAEKSWSAYYSGILSEDQIKYMLSLMYSKSALTKDFNNENYEYYLLSSSDEEPVGFMGIELNYEPGTTTLHRLYLLKSEKGKGYGAAAMNFLKKLVKNQQGNKIILNVNKNNPAKKFYEAQGFTVYDEGVFDIGNGYVMDDYLMEILL